MGQREGRMKGVVRREIVPFLEAPRGKRASIRERVLKHIEKMIEQTDDDGKPSKDAQVWWAWVIKRTDPEPTKDGAGAPGAVFAGPVQVVLRYEGPDPAPRADDLPPLPPRGSGGDSERGGTVERGAVRKAVRKDNAGRA